MKSRAFSRIFAVALLATAIPLVISAAGPTVAEGPNGTKITVDDLNADALRLPPASRAQALVVPDAVQQAATNIYIRRVLAQEALRDGLDKDPSVAAQLQLVRERILSDARLAKIDAANKPTEQAVEAAARAAYEAEPEKFRTRAQTRASHILIQGNTEKGKEKAERILAQVKAGGDFGKIAREVSADPGSAERGGDLGWFESGNMVQEFEDALAKLQKPGEISDLVPSQYGWHIIRLEGRRPAGVRTYPEIRDELRAMVTNQLHSDVRLREAKRIAETIKVDRPAIEAYSAAHRK